jgi:hypothetical protein
MRGYRLRLSGNIALPGNFPFQVSLPLTGYCHVFKGFFASKSYQWTKRSAC